MNRTLRLLAAAALGLGTLLLAAPQPAAAQSLVLTMPMDSQGAMVGQRIGLTDVTITYHRPLVKGRKIWGDLVPYGQVWRAGANDNTVFEVSSDVKIEGQALPRGRYGLHMIPTADSWTVIFSKNSTSWGSFSYDQAEDVLRVTVKPAASEMVEALAYDFTDVAPASAVAELRWEKLRVPFKVEVDVRATTLASLRNQLRHLAGFGWAAWNDAATYALTEKADYEEALRWADTSIQSEERFENLDTKANILAAMGKTSEADAIHKQALSKASALQMHGYARQLMGQKRTAEAIAVFEANAKKNPDAWVVHIGMARAYSAQGKFPEALKELEIGIAKAPEPQRPPLLGLKTKLEAKQDIN